METYEILLTWVSVLNFFAVLPIFLIVAAVVDAIRESKKGK